MEQLALVLFILFVIAIIHNCVLASNNKQLKQSIKMLSDPITQSLIKPYHHVTYYAYLYKLVERERRDTRELLDRVLQQTVIRDHFRLSKEHHPFFIPDDVQVFSELVEFAKKKEWISQSFGTKYPFIPITEIKDDVKKFKDAVNIVTSHI